MLLLAWLALAPAVSFAQQPAVVDTALRGAVPYVAPPPGARPDTTTPPPPGQPARAARDTAVLRPAQPAAPDSFSLRSPRRRAAILRADTTGLRRQPKGFLTAPRWVMLRSLVFPGWGQLENRAWLKALILGGADGYLRVRAVKDERDLRRLLGDVNQAKSVFDQDAATWQELKTLYGDTSDVAMAAAGEMNLANARYNDLANSYNSLLNGQVSRLWLLGGVVVYAMIDAYVDAHFRNFKIEFEQDPALPGGKPGSGRMRLFMRWAF